MPLVGAFPDANAIVIECKAESHPQRLAGLLGAFVRLVEGGQRTRRRGRQR